MGENYLKKIILGLGFILVSWAAQAQYCIPTSTYDCLSGDNIEDVVIEDSNGVTVFSHLYTGCSPAGYGDFTADPNLHIELEAGETYSFEITHDMSSQYIKMWIDTDSNQSFDANEVLFTSSTGSGFLAPTAGIFTAPNVQGVVTTRMRIIASYASATSSPCSTGTWGEAHDYTVTIVGENPACYSPDNLQASVVSSAEVEISWDAAPHITEGFEWALMNSGDHPDNDTPVDSGALASGSTSVLIGSLQQAIFYDFYIKGECAGSEFSVWRDIEFFIASPGSACFNPIEVTSLPYSDTNDTADFMNLIEGAPGTNCGTADEYLYGNDVIYKFEADDDYLLVVSLEDLDEEYTAVFVYESCDDIGIECAAVSSFVKDSMSDHGFDFGAEDGKTYYFVVSSAQPTTDFEYTFKIEGYNCASIPAPITSDASPFFIQGAALSSLMNDIKILDSSQFFTWYSDAALTNEIADPDNEVLVAGNSYYITQTVVGCESAYLEMTPQEIDCSFLDVTVDTPEVKICVPGGYAMLKASLSAAGDEIYWYDSEAGVDPVYKGSVYDLGFVENSTSYWVSEVALATSTPTNALPSYCVPYMGSSGCNLSDYINDFILEDNLGTKLIEHLGSGCSAGAYDDLTGNPAYTATLVAGETYDFKATFGTSSQYLRIWIDYDGNGSFEDAGEFVFHATSAGSSTIATTGSFTIPAGSPAVNTVMRVRTTFSTGTADSCTQSSSYGEVHDYKISIIGQGVACESARIEVPVIVSSDIPPAPEVDSNYVFCGLDTYTLADIEVEGGGIVWYDAVGNEMDETTEVFDGDVYYVLDTSGGCLSHIAEVHISIRDLSATPTGPENQTFTQGSGATLADLDVVGVQLKWYADEDLQNLLDIDTPLVDDTTYYVTQTRTGLCESLALAIHVTETLSVADVNFTGFKFFPNPVSDLLNLVNDKEINTIEIYDATGRLVHKQENINKDNYTISLAEMATGNYILKISVDSQIKTVQLIKK